MAYIYMYKYNLFYKHKLYKYNYKINYILNKESIIL